MIYDQLDNLKNYQGIHTGLKIAIEFLTKTDSTSLVIGKNDILGDDVFLMLQENDLHKTFTGYYEYHRKYLDLHITVEGEETIICGFDKDKEIKAYNDKEDYGMVTCQHKESMLVPKNYFILFFPEEAHKPSIVTKNSTHIKKYVIKIAI